MCKQNTLHDVNFAPISCNRDMPLIKSILYALSDTNRAHTLTRKVNLHIIWVLCVGAPLFTAVKTYHLKQNKKQKHGQGTVKCF